MTVELKSIGALPDFQIKQAWNVLRLWQVSDLRIEKNKPNAQLLSVFLNRGVIRYGEGGGQVHKPGRDLSVYQVVKRGDLVLNNQQAWRGSVGVSRYDGIISPAYVVLRLRESIVPRFGDYLFQSRVMVDQYVTSSKGVGDIQREAYLVWLKNVKVPVPPPDEQELIVRFLDWASVRLGKSIAAKRKVIGLLEEQKQAIIHRAVTRGLDDTAPLKPSGLDWLGDVPEHWELRRLKTLLKRIDQGVSPLASNYLADANSWGVLKSGCVNGGTFRQLQHKRLDRDFVIPKSLAVMIGDVLISRACGSVKYVGSVGRVRLLDYKLILSDKTFRPVFRESVSIEFIVRAMNSRYYRQQVEQSLSGADGLANNLPLTDLKTFWFALPPLHEANQIAEILDSSLSQSETTIRNLASEIQLLQEYRTRLIADVVTGKLDVREFARTLPADISYEAAELASSELGDDEFTDSDDELVDKLAGEPA